jgi:hypothetical protein
MSSNLNTCSNVERNKEETKGRRNREVEKCGIEESIA